MAKDKDALIEATVGQSLEKISLTRCADLWQRLSRGELGSGARIQAVQRSLAGRLNHSRSDHVRRLFLTLFDPVMQRAPAFVDGTVRVPGCLHMIDLGALWLALRDQALQGLGEQVQRWLSDQAQSQPIFEVVQTKQALAYREQLRDAAVAAMESRWQRQKHLDKFLQAVNDYRQEAARTAFGQDVLPPRLRQEDLDLMRAALKMADPLREHAEEITASPEIPPDGVAEQIRNQLQNLRKACPNEAKTQQPWMIPGLAAIHKHRRIDVIAALLPDLPREDQTLISDAAAAHHQIAGERLRRFFDDGYVAKDLDGDQLDHLDDDFAVFEASAELAERSDFRSAGQTRRRIVTLTRHVRETAVQRGTEAAGGRITPLLQTANISDDYYVNTRRLLALLHSLGTLQVAELSESKRYQNWRVDQLKAMHRGFTRAAENIEERDLAAYMARLVSLAGALEGDTDSWVRVISQVLIKGAMKYLEDRARLPGETTKREAEALTLRAVGLAMAELRRSTGVQTAEVRDLRQAAESWAARHKRDISWLEDEYVLPDEAE